MLMAYIWLGMMAVSVLCGAATGNLNAVSVAVTEGAGAAVTLAIGLTGPLCLWSAVMEVMQSGGLMDALGKLLQPLLRRIYPVSFSDGECAGAISANFTANLLGLGSAATPAGLRAVTRMNQLDNTDGELCRMVVMNTASVQLLPATVAAVRSAFGAAAPFDLLPCVWLTSLGSVTVGLLVERGLARWIR